MSRPTTVVENATTRFVESASTFPRARATSAGLIGMRVPMSPRIGPTRMNTRVRSRRLLAWSSRSFRRFSVRVRDTSPDEHMSWKKRWKNRPPFTKPRRASASGACPARRSSRAAVAADSIAPMSRTRYCQKTS